uniref:helix-turn-helix domain-containing protein n=1 Tax=Herbidospora sakaeratensis TaxID=564415 RepID=UPI000A6E28A0|nr:helix-turn-helix domain-containing protein [Herbidospora sakaeratensis]
MRTPLGDFLRARRQTVSPGQVGLPCGDHRRTPGLRREEVAFLAKVSTDYYTKLEQGIERRPSDQVLDALARVFRLDGDAAGHLRALARPPRSRSEAADPDQEVNPQVLRLMDQWHDVAAAVVNHRTDVLACNVLWGAITGGDFGRTGNLLRILFLDPRARDRWIEWDTEAGAMVAHLRAGLGTNRDDPSGHALVAELSEASEDFRRMWARHDVRLKRRDPVLLRHHLVGDLTLWHESFAIDSAPGRRLWTAQAEPGSPTEVALGVLRTLARAEAG